MRYAFGEEAIGNRAFPVLVQVFTAAFAVTDELAVRAGLAPGQSPIAYAHVLTGGEGDDAGEKLFGVINEEAVRLESAGTPDAALSGARRALANLYTGRTPAAHNT